MSEKCAYDAFSLKLILEWPKYWDSICKYYTRAKGY